MSLSIDVKSDAMMTLDQLHVAYWLILLYKTFSLSYEAQMVIVHFTPSMLQEHPLHLEIDENIYAQGEPRFVRQIIRNLLTNACRYTPPQTPIWLRARYVKEPGYSGIHRR